MERLTMDAWRRINLAAAPLAVSPQHRVDG
jgi:hypothetical protein